MPKVMVTEQYLQDVANAIRSMGGVTTTYTPAEMAAAIMSIASNCDATTADVLSPKTAISASGPITGSIGQPATGGVGYIATLRQEGTNLYAGIPAGAYLTNNPGYSYPEIAYNYNDIIYWANKNLCNVSSRITSVSGGLRFHNTSAGGSGYYDALVGIINRNATMINTGYTENSMTQVLVPGWVSTSYLG